MEYLILFMVAAVAAIAITTIIVALVSLGDERHTDDERFDSVRDALEEQSAPWRPHVRNSK